MAGNDIFLFSVPSDASANDVRLRDPTTSGGSGVGYTLSGAAGNYSVAGQAAAFNVGRLLSGAAGAYAVSGLAGLFNTSRQLSGAAGGYAITGQAATLTYIPGAAGVAYTLSGAAGAYALTGYNAIFYVEPWYWRDKHDGFKKKHKEEPDRRPRPVKQDLEKVIAALERSPDVVEEVADLRQMFPAASAPIDLERLSRDVAMLDWALQLYDYAERERITREAEMEDEDEAMAVLL